MNRISFFRGLTWLCGAAVALGAAIPMGADAANILHLSDVVRPSDKLANALKASGHSVTVASGVDDFSKKLSSGNFELAVLQVQSADPSEYLSAITALQTFVSSGGKAIYFEWSGKSALAAPFGATYTAAKNQAQVTIQDPALKSGGPSPEMLQLRNTTWFQFSSGLAPAGQGSAVAATYANGEAAIVFGNSGRSVVFGYQSDVPANEDVYRRTLLSLLKPAESYPVTKTGPATLVTTTSATLTATVNPRSLPTSVIFEYESGTGAPIRSAAQEIGSGSDSVQVQTTLTGLTPHTAYTWRVRATSSGGTSVGADAVFTTNSLPLAISESVRVTGASSSVVVPLLANDHDPDGDAVTLTAFNDARSGTVINNGDGTVTYTPGATFSGLDEFTYEISDGYGGSATALVTLLRDPERINGTYQQLLTDSAGKVDGLVQISVNARGAFTGSLWFQGKRFPITGVLKLDQTKVLVKTRKGTSSLTLNLELTRENDRSRLTGSLTDGTENWNLNTGRLAYNRKNMPPESGQRYTLLMEANPASDPDYGHGWALFTVQSSGAVRLSGQLGNGTPFSATTFITPDAQLPLYIAPSQQPTSTLTGTLAVRNDVVSDVDGTLTWTRSSEDSAPEAQVEITNLPTHGSRYKAPKRGELALDFSSHSPALAEVSFWGEPIAPPFSRLLRVGTNFTTSVQNAGEERLKLHVDQRTGRAFGTLRYPKQPTLKINGVVLQKENSAKGNAGAKGEFGGFTLTPQ